MSCIGGATAPLSSSSSESAFGLFSDLATAWFSMDPLPSPPASGCLPVISSTAASTATEAENTSGTRQTGQNDSLTHILWKLIWQLSTCFSSGPKWSFDNPSEWHFHHQSHDANVATNRIGLDSEKQLTLRKCASPETFHELIHLNKGTLQRETTTDSLLSGRKKLFFFCFYPFQVNMSMTVLSCCNSQWST